MGSTDGHVNNKLGVDIFPKAGINVPQWNIKKMLNLFWTTGRVYKEIKLV
ncbi:MAG: hypothetical protein LBR15_08295 [Methanobrevibacter sp.]|jgi:hypothetical protein|nr:hypothetical protein [Candidatus Methanovirga australis]